VNNCWCDGEDPGCETCHPWMTAEARVEARAKRKVRDAAQELLRALLNAEWAFVEWDEVSVGPECMGCDNGPCLTSPRSHVPGCPIDAALTLAGLPDQASRDAARGKP
jgi:hypothetical protein